MFIKKLTRQVICNLDEPVVSTPRGRLRGVQVDDGYIFRGVKYADAARFAMPKPVEPWEGVKDAIMYGYACPEISTGVPGDGYTVPHLFCPQHEDCQYLNIWTQSIDQTAKKPVMVWLHGGGYSTGSGVEHYAYDGEELSAHGDVVVVTLNHRLNVLGHLDLSAYGDEYQHSAYLGIIDIVAALEWVKENIACFGGDPDNVTIFGQSGGGGKVLALMQMPAADGLYHRAVVQSGVFTPAPAAEARKASRHLAELVLEELGTDVEGAKTVPYTVLAAAASRATARLMAEGTVGFSWAPVPDGEYYVGYPTHVGFRKEALHVPLMLGTVFAEFTSNYSTPIGDSRKNDWSDETAEGYLRERFGEYAPGMIEGYRAAYPGRRLADLLYMDTFVRRGTAEMAKLRAKQGSKAWCYLFDLETPFKNGTLAWHNSEIPYVFHNAEYIEASYIPGVSEPLQDLVSGAWVSFAKNGDPNHPGMPAWNKATEASCPTMIFERESYVAVDHDQALLDAAPKMRSLASLFAKKKDKPAHAPQGPQKQ